MRVTRTPKQTAWLLQTVVRVLYPGELLGVTLLADDSRDAVVIPARR